MGAGARRTKIIATVGPASRDPDTLLRMVKAGMDLARINASHADPGTIAEEVRAVRAAAARVGKTVGVILDLMGPKLRLGEVEEGTYLQEGRDFILTDTREEGDAYSAPVSWPPLLEVLHPGDRVLVDDGSIVLRVLDREEGGVRCRVEKGGCLGSRKGINLPGRVLDLPPLTEKDLADVELGVQLGVDWLALSFVRTAENLQELKKAIAERGGDIPIIAKIEKREAVERLDSIVEAADAVMVARGDLGVEMPLEEVPILQRRVVQAAMRAGKPVIVATQMLQSMMDSPVPTRAEVSDVAEAVWEGADAVMLSGETAVGSFPVEAVSTMERIILRTEPHLPYEEWLAAGRRWAGSGTVEAVCLAACELALQLGAGAIVTPTDSGFTARQMSRFRPRQLILALTPRREVASRLTLHWGVHPAEVPVQGSVEEIFSSAEEAARRLGFLEKGRPVVVTAGIRKPGKGIPTTDTIHCIPG
jgi:pyruvate kinase